MKRDRFEKIILVSAIIGILLASYALSLHYSGDGKKLCDIGENFDCDKVNKSPWSKLFGIPVALLGMLSYALVFLTVLKRRTIQKSLAFTKKDFWQYLFIFTVVMTGFQIYLTMTEVLYIHAYCLVCLVSQVLVLILLVSSFLAWMKG